MKTAEITELLSGRPYDDPAISRPIREDIEAYRSHVWNSLFEMFDGDPSITSSDAGELAQNGADAIAEMLIRQWTGIGEIA